MNLFQHLKESNTYKALNQVQCNKKGVTTQSLDGGGQGWPPAQRASRSERGGQKRFGPSLVPPPLPPLPRWGGEVFLCKNVRDKSLDFIWKKIRIGRAAVSFLSVWSPMANSGSRNYRGYPNFNLFSLEG